MVHVSAWKTFENELVKHPAPQFVYALLDPRDLATRYIGVCTHMDVRMKEHLYTRQANLPKRHWLQELLGHGVEPLMCQVEVVDQGGMTALEREFRWICEMIRQGKSLLNREATTWWVTENVNASTCSNFLTADPQTMRDLFVAPCKMEQWFAQQCQQPTWTLVAERNGLQTWWQ